MAKQHQFKEPLFVEINGITYEGYRIVKGTRKLSQTIYFKDFKDLDTKTYEYPKMENYKELAKVMATTHLHELVKKHLGLL